MLIESSRITIKDKELWGELLFLDEAHSTSNGYKYRKKQAVEIIKSFIEKERDYFVALSWGKDSVVLAHLFHSLGAECKYVYIRNTAREPEGNLAVRNEFLSWHKIDYEEVAYNYADADETYFNRKGQPTKWYNILKDLQRKYGTHVTGVRYDESSKRKLRFIRHGLETENSFAPFRYFNVNDVFAYLYEHNLPVHPNYAMLGGGRWDKYRIRVSAIGNKEGDGMGRQEWEKEYYPDIYRRCRIAL